MGNVARHFVVRTMLSRLIAALWPWKTTSALSTPARSVTQVHWPVRPQSTAAEVVTESQKEVPPPPLTEREVQCDLSRVYLAYSSIHDSHRDLFDRYLTLPVQLRDKVSANIIGTMDSLEGIAESLLSADVRLNARELYDEYAVKWLDEEELCETKLDIQEAAEDLQYLRSRVDRVGSTIERLESDQTQRSQLNLNAG